MKTRSARPCFDVHVRARSSPILRVVERSLDLELLNGIRSGDRNLYWGGAWNRLAGRHPGGCISQVLSGWAHPGVGHFLIVQT